MRQEEEYQKLKGECDEKCEVLEGKLKDLTDYTNLSQDERAKREKVVEMSTKIITLNRKCVYLETSELKLSNDVKKLQDDVLNLEKANNKKLNKIETENKCLLNETDIFRNKLKNTASQLLLLQTQNNLDNLTLKLRDLLQRVAELETKHTKELSVLKETNEMFKKEKEELAGKLVETLNKLKYFEVSSFTVETAIEILTKKLSQTEVNEITERQRGNHINNLYELVKEQLKNSEDRYTEFEKFNKEIMRKNLQLQENVKDLQDKVIHYVDVNAFRELQEKYTSLLEDKEKILQNHSMLTQELEIIKKSFDCQNLWTNLKEYEFLNLKHQIVDLQSTTDAKAIIARLSSDVVNARLTEADCRKTIDDLRNELNKLEDEYNQCQNNLIEERKEHEELSQGFSLKIR